MAETPPLAVVALVPMRHFSERVLEKNFRPFAGRPLFHHIVETLLSCPSIEHVVIDTDSPRIRMDAAAAFPDVKLLERAEHLRGGDVPMNEVLLDDVRRVEGEVYLQTHSTNPLLLAATIERAIGAFAESRPAHDSLFSVTPRRARYWAPDGTPVNHDPDRLLRTQDLAPLLEENSCLYLFSREGLLERRNRIGDRPLLFEMDPREAWDIDDESDFEIAEMMFRHRQEVAGR